MLYRKEVEVTLDATTLGVFPRIDMVTGNVTHIITLVVAILNGVPMAELYVQTATTQSATIFVHAFGVENMDLAFKAVGIIAGADDDHPLLVQLEQSRQRNHNN